MVSSITRLPSALQSDPKSEVLLSMVLRAASSMLAVSTMIIDETANIEEAARNTMLSKTSDFGSDCSADGNLVIEETIFDKLLAQLVKEGGYLASEDEKAKLKA